MGIFSVYSPGLVSENTLKISRASKIFNVKGASEPTTFTNQISIRNGKRGPPKPLSDRLPFSFVQTFSPLEVDHIRGSHKRHKPNKNPLGEDIPYAKGVVVRNIVKKPGKPNSANRK